MAAWLLQGVLGFLFVLQDDTTKFDSQSKTYAAILGTFSRFVERCVELSGTSPRTGIYMVSGQEDRLLAGSGRKICRLHMI